MPALNLNKPYPCWTCPEGKKRLAELEAQGVQVIKHEEVPTWAGAKIMPDGAVVYAKKGFEPPPELEGFERDPENAWRFIPRWPACKKRIQTPLVKQCGAITVLSVCAHSQCPFRQQEVTVADCQGCPLRIE